MRTRKQYAEEFKGISKGNFLSKQFISMLNPYYLDKIISYWLCP